MVTTNKPIDAETYNGTEGHTNKDIAHKMDAEVEAGPAIQYAPKEQCNRGGTMAHEHAHKYGDGHGIGGMG